MKVDEKKSQIQTNKQIDRQTGGQANEQTNKQTNRQAKQTAKLSVSEREQRTTLYATCYISVLPQKKA